MFRFSHNKETGEVRVYRVFNGHHRKKRLTPYDRLPTEDDGEVPCLRTTHIDRERALVGALHKLLSKVKVCYGESGVTVEDSSLSGFGVSELSIILETMRGKNIIPTQVFSGRNRIDMEYKMGFNETPKTCFWVSQFVRAYTYEEFPVWLAADYITLNTCDSLGLVNTFIGMNPYSLLLKHVQFRDMGDVFLPKGFDLYKVMSEEKARTESGDIPFHFSYWVHPSSFDVHLAYKKIHTKVNLRLKNNYRVVDMFGDIETHELTMPSDAEVRDIVEFPTLKELCIAKLYTITIDQTRGSFKDRYDLPHWVPIRGLMPKNRVLSQYAPLLRPDYYFHEGAFKTGASEEGIYQALIKISKFDRPCISADPRHVVAATITMFKSFNMLEKFEMYKDKDDILNTIGAMSIPWDRNAGIHLCATGPISSSVYECGGYRIEEEQRFTWDVNQKRNAIGGVLKMTEEQICYLISMFLEKGMAAYDKNWFFHQIAKLGNKVEILGPEADRDKNRVFFIGCLMKMILQKVTLSAPFREMFGRDFCGIGHCWSGGGSYRVANQLKFTKFGKEAWRWFQGDFRALDQSMKAGLMCYICIMMALTFKPGVTPDQNMMYKVCLATLAFLGDDTAVTLIKWFGKEWRYIIGVLFSGEFVTSMFDTIYVYIALMVVHYSFIEDLKKICREDYYVHYKKKILEAMENFALIYGDDTTWHLPYEVVRIIEAIPGVGKGLYMETVIKRLKTIFDMEMKPKGSSDTDEFDTPYTLCTHDGILLQENGKYGLKFLRRHFVRSTFTIAENSFLKEPYKKEVITSMRKISDVWARATNTHHDASSYLQWHPRVKAFIYENMGVSLATDRFLRMFILSIEKNLDYLDAKEGDDYVVLAERFGYSKIKDQDGRAVKFDRGDRDLVDKYKRVMPWITEDEIFSHIVPDRQWLLKNLAYKTNDLEHRSNLHSSYSLRQGVFKCDDEELHW